MRNGFERASPVGRRFHSQAFVIQPHKLVGVVGLGLLPVATAASAGWRGGSAAAGRGLVAVADVAGAGRARPAGAVHVQPVAAGVGVAHGVVVGIGVAVLRDGRFQIAQVGVAGGERAQLRVVVPRTQVLQPRLPGREKERAA